MRNMIIAVAGLVAMLPVTASAQAVDGQKAFAPCAACHATTAGTNRLGPSLNKIVGRKIASAPGFKYSAGLSAKKGTWTPANLDAYLADNKAFAPGNRMSFPGVKDATKRAALIGYLKTLK